MNIKAQKNKDMMQEQPYAQIALKRMGAIPKNFLVYRAEWLGAEKDPKDWVEMKVTGAQFREAKRGPNKGELCIKVPHTDRVAYVTEAEIKIFEKNQKNAKH